MRDRADSRIERLVRTNADDLLAYLHRRVVPPADAADLLAETLLVAWRREAELPIDDVEARRWLFGVARRTLANHARGRRRSHALAARLREELALISATTADPAEGIERDVVRQALASLQDDDRELLMLVGWDGFTVGAAGAILGIGASTARSRFSRAKERLRSELERCGDPVPSRLARLTRS